MAGTTNGKRNRNAGHAWEREGVKDFTPLYPEVATSRSCNRVRDAQKVDLAYPDEHRLGRFPYNAQYKNYAKPVHYAKLLSELPKTEGVINVIMHKQTEKAGTRFITKDKFAILYYEDFFKLAAKRRGYEIIEEYVDFIPDEERKELESRLKDIGL